MKKLVPVLFLLATTAAFAENAVWHQKANFGGTARHRSTAFSIGNKGYVGLGHINAVSNIEYEDFWEYDPGTNTWTQMANFAPGVRYHAIGFSVGAKGYVGLGREEDGDYENDLWEFDPIANTWTQRTNFPGGNRRGSVSFVINGIAYVGSGEVEVPAISNQFYAYDASQDLWWPIADFPGSERTSAVAFSIGDKGYFGTGGLGFGTNDFWEYNPATNLWTQLADVGTAPRMEACGFAVNGKGYIGTGDDFSSGNNYSDFWEFDPSTGNWTQIDDFPGVARRYMVAFVIGPKVFTCVGTNGTNFRDLWEFDKLLTTDESQLTKVKVFPNPIVSDFTVSYSALNSTSCIFTLYTNSGELVRQEILNPGENQFSRQGIASGTYHYIITEGEVEMASGNLIFIE